MEWEVYLRDTTKSKSFVNRLQELVQKAGFPLPEYSEPLLPLASFQFEVAVRSSDEQQFKAVGVSCSKKSEAKQSAARELLKLKAFQVNFLRACGGDGCLPVSLPE